MSQSYNYENLTRGRVASTLVTWHCVEKRTLAKGSDRPSLSAANRPRPWYRWHRSWKYLLSAERERGRPLHDQVQIQLYGSQVQIFKGLLCWWTNFNVINIHPVQSLNRLPEFQLTHPDRTDWQEASSSPVGRVSSALLPPLHKLA